MEDRRSTALRRMLKPRLRQDLALLFEADVAKRVASDYCLAGRAKVNAIAGSFSRRHPCRRCCRAVWDTDPTGLTDLIALRSVRSLSL